jgi:hypothetical protein
MEKDVYSPWRYFAIAGSMLFVFWILFNGMDEGFQPATPAEMIQYLSMIVLLSVTATLLSKGVYARYIALVSSAAFILLFIFGAFESGAHMTAPQIMSHIALACLLALNSFLLFPRHE